MFFLHSFLYAYSSRKVSLEIANVRYRYLEFKVRRLYNSATTRSIFIIESERFYVWFVIEN